MRPFQTLEQSALIDLLAYVTARYTKMFSSDMVNIDYTACRELLLLLQSEVAARQNNHQSFSGDNRDCAFNLSV